MARRLLALRAFRESYLKIWILGWTALVVSGLAEHCLSRPGFRRRLIRWSCRRHLCSRLGCLAGAVLLYARMRDLIIPLMVITPVLVGFAGARVLLWPESLPLRMALEIGYRFVLLTAAVALLRARRGRWELAAWLLALTCRCCICPGRHSPIGCRLGARFALKLRFGLSMLLVVLDEARARTRRLSAMQRITEGIAGAPSNMGSCRTVRSGGI